jgi:uncharacterized glyoxalase superfamily protein PhnB
MRELVLPRVYLTRFLREGIVQELQSLGANIEDPLETKPWGMRQFTVGDLDGNLFYFHRD